MKFVRKNLNRQPWRLWLFGLLLVALQGDIAAQLVFQDWQDQDLSTQRPLVDFELSECFENGDYLVMKNQKNPVYKKILNNGMTVLVHPSATVPKVSTQLFYNVGSKDERTGEKGIAHLIEHMIFKGTEKLSESDINEITHKLSGYCNAFTSYDYTGYVFDFPAHTWRHALDMMADCMRNCSFKEEHLNSELKAVIQELKMYKDNYGSDLVEKMISVIFTGHPYTNPIIGYKHDLWSLKRQSLVDFYQHHYVPNNATLVVVGDVDPAEVFDLAEQKFGAIEPVKGYAKSDFYVPQDIVSKSVTIYRDVQQPIMVLAYVIPGSKLKQDYLADTLSLMVGSGRGSRLWRRLVDELQIAVDVECFTYDLFDAGLFFIDVHPTKLEYQAQIMEVIQSELNDLAVNGPQAGELQRAMRKIKKDYLSLLESNHKQAYALGRSYLATGDENYLFDYVSRGEAQKDLGGDLQKLVAKHLRPSLTHTGFVLPMAKGDRSEWGQLQKISDAEDQRILSGRERLAGVEPAAVAEKIKPERCPKFDFPKYDVLQLENGVEVLYYNRPDLPKINLILELKAGSQYDPEEKTGICNFMSRMLLEGTKRYSAQELANEIERYGMDFDTSPGYVTMSMLSEDFARGLDLLHHILTESSFDKVAVERVRTQILTELKHYWDEPSQFIGQLVREQIYPNHPYSKNAFGTEASILAVTQKDLLDFYQQFVSPFEARLAIVGDLTGCDFGEVLNQSIGKWTGPAVADIVYPELPEVVAHDVNYQIQRDQVTWCIAGKSVERTDPDYDKLVLFDQIFTGGALRSMSSKLFELREQSGLFYTIGGSLVSQSGKQPGMTLVRTIVSHDRLSEAENKIKNLIDAATIDFTADDIQSAVNAITSTTIDSFDSNRKIAQAFLFLRKYNLPLDYFDSRAEQLAKYSLSEIATAVKKYLDTNKMVTVRVGRV